MKVFVITLNLGLSEENTLAIIVMLKIIGFTEAVLTLKPRDEFAWKSFLACPKATRSLS